MSKNVETPQPAPNQNKVAMKVENAAKDGANIPIKLEKGIKEETQLCMKARMTGAWQRLVGTREADLQVSRALRPSIDLGSSPPSPPTRVPQPLRNTPAGEIVANNSKRVADEHDPVDEAKKKETAQ